MGKEGDSIEVIIFMSVFRKLIDYCDDQPRYISEMLKDDQIFTDLCIKTTSIAKQLKAAEVINSNLFTAPVNSSFIHLWRRYESAYEVILDQEVFRLTQENGCHDLVPETILSALRSVRSKDELGDFDAEWEEADLNGKIAVDLIEKSLAYAALNYEKMMN